MATTWPSKNKDVSCPDFKIKRGGWAVFFVIYYFLLHAFFTRYYTFPQGYVGALRSNINKMKRSNFRMQGHF